MTVFESAVAERSGVIAFEDGINSHTGHLSSKGNREVRVVSLDDLVTKGEIPPRLYEN